MAAVEETTGRRRRGVQEQASERRREEILIAAATAYAERGFNATSLRDVASRAGLSHTGLLHHYPDKTTLLQALLDSRLRGAGALDRVDAGDGDAFFVGLVALAERDERQPANLKLLTVLTTEAINPEHPAHEYFTAWHRDVQARIARALHHLAADGRYRSNVAVDTAARHLDTLREGTHTLWLLSDGGFSLVDEVRSHIEAYADVDWSSASG